MPVIALRTYEPWTPWSVLAAIFLFAVFVTLLIVVLGRDNR
jgi:hypothetical protein